MANQSYSGRELELALRDGELAHSQTTLTGMVKQCDKNDHISFTCSNCDDGWVDIPTDMIKSAKSVGEQSCKDHSHPIMEIALNEPKDPQGEILMALLSQTTNQMTPRALSASNNMMASNVVAQRPTVPMRSRSANAIQPQAFASAAINPLGQAFAAPSLGGGGFTTQFSCDSFLCDCTGDADCNDMFSTDVCGDLAFCDADTGKCYCFRF